MRKRPAPTATVALAIVSLFMVTACVTTEQTEGESGGALEAVKARFKSEPATEPAAAPASEPATAPAPAPSPSPPPSNANWIQISDKPFSYFPKGLPKDTPTDHLNGEWVNSGDRSSRWFVPKGGVGERSEKELQAEALSLRTQADNALSAQGESRTGDRIGLASRLSLPFRKSTETSKEE